MSSKRLRQVVSGAETVSVLVSLSRTRRAQGQLLEGLSGSPGLSRLSGLFGWSGLSGPPSGAGKRYSRLQGAHWWSGPLKVAK